MGGSLARRCKHKEAEPGASSPEPRRLYPIDAIISEVGTFEDKQQCAQMIASAFRDKWASNKLAKRSSLVDAMLETEGLEMDLQVEDIQLAFTPLRRQYKFDGSGLCVRIYSLLFISAPHVFASWLAKFLSRMVTVGSCELTAHAFGKEQAKTRTSAVRLIVPLSCLLQIADAILATKLDEFLKFNGLRLPSQIFLKGRVLEHKT